MFGLRRQTKSFGMSGLSHKGAVREENEDAIDWWVSADGSIRFALLADGMGGHAGGAFASALAIKTVRRHIEENLPRIGNNQDRLEQVMADALQQANSQIHDARNEIAEYCSMGTTVVFVAIWNARIIVLYVGDSRCYVSNENTQAQLELEHITRDDSVVQAMLEEGVITELDIPNIPYRNKLTNALGVNAELNLNSASRMFRQSDIALLCSDGFYQSVDFAKVTDALEVDGATPEVTERLLNMSLDNRTDDNTSVLVISGQAF